MTARDASLIAFLGVCAWLTLVGAVTVLGWLL